MLLAAEPTLECEGKRKPVPETGGPGARIRAPGGGCPAGQPKLTTAAQGPGAAPWPCEGCSHPVGGGAESA